MSFVDPRMVYPDQLPPWSRIYRMLRDRIVGGQYAPGERIPSVRELQADEQVAKATVEKAIRQLRTEGLIKAVPGIGNVVASSDRIDSPRDMFLRVAGFSPSIRLPNERSEYLHLRVVDDAPVHVLDGLGLERGARVIVRSRLIRRSGRPVMIATSYFDGGLVEVAPKLLVPEPIISGTPGYVAGMTGRRPVSARDEIEPVALTKARARLLAVEPGSPALRTRNWVYDAEMQVIEYGEYFSLPGYRVSYDYDLLPST